MKATDLRIGNYLYLLVKNKDNGKTTSKIIFKINDGKHIDTICDGNQEDFIEPIPLSEEVLLKCPQFEKENHGWYSFKYFTDCSLTAEQMMISYNIHTGRFSVCDLEEDSTPIFTAKAIKHLHVFQNAIFALTNQELTINL